MGMERLSVSIEETTIARFDAAVDSYIDEVWDRVDIGSTPSNARLSVRMHVDASDDTTTRTFTFSIQASDTTQALITAMWGDFTTGVSAAIAESEFDAISKVYGRVSVTVEY